MKTLLLALTLTLAACTQSAPTAVVPNPNPLSGYAPDTTLCCPDGYRCRYRPDLGRNQYGSAWWCISTSNPNMAGEPTRCR